MSEDSPNAKYILIGIAAVAVAIVIGIVIGCMVTANDFHYKMDSDNSNNDLHFTFYDDEYSGAVTQNCLLIMSCNDTSRPTFCDDLVMFDGVVCLGDPNSGYNAFIPASIVKGRPVNMDNISLDDMRVACALDGLHVIS